jgi:hypothetical protein
MGNLSAPQKIPLHIGIYSENNTEIMLVWYRFEDCCYRIHNRIDTSPPKFCTTYVKSCTDISRLIELIVQSKALLRVQVVTNFGILPILLDVEDLQNYVQDLLPIVKHGFLIPEGDDVVAGLLQRDDQHSVM